MPSVRYFKTDIGAKQGFALKERKVDGSLGAIDITTKTVVFVFEDYDGNVVTVSGSDVVKTDAANGEGYYIITAAVTAEEKEWQTVQAKITEGLTYIEHSDPIVVVIGDSAGS
jgi:hypothetical protein